MGNILKAVVIEKIVADEVAIRNRISNGYLSQINLSLAKLVIGRFTEVEEQSAFVTCYSSDIVVEDTRFKDTTISEGEGSVIVVISSSVRMKNVTFEGFKYGEELKSRTHFLVQLALNSKVDDFVRTIN